MCPANVSQKWTKLVPQQPEQAEHGVGIVGVTGRSAHLTRRTGRGRLMVAAVAILMSATVVFADRSPAIDAGRKFLKSLSEYTCPTCGC